jgi:hypothetical protein
MFVKPSLVVPKQVRVGKDSKDFRFGLLSFLVMLYLIDF